MARITKPGFIFLCSDTTQEECLRKKLFGGKETYIKKVRQLQKGDRLFLYNYNTKRLLGVFAATSELGTDIDPTAWSAAGGYPLQVKTTRLHKYKPLSREDIAHHPILKDHIKFDRAGRPTARLDELTTAALEAAFASDERVVVYDNEARYHTDDGHRVKSMPERDIDNWLFKHRIAHVYEPQLPDSKRADFGIPLADGSMLYIEYWGMHSRSYLRNKTYKQKIYKQHDLQVIEIEPKDLPQLETLLENDVLPLIDTQ